MNHTTYTLTATATVKNNITPLDVKQTLRPPLATAIDTRTNNVEITETTFNQPDVDDHTQHTQKEMEVTATITVEEGKYTTGELEQQARKVIGIRFYPAENPTVNIQ